MTFTCKQISWTQIKPAPDPIHGSPIARSSHGLSVVHHDESCRLILLFGEHTARTPIDSSNNQWAADFNPESQSWTWRLMQPGGDGPQDRVAHAQAACPSQRQVYIFGGRAGIAMEEKAMNDLWKLDVSGPPGTESWSKIIPNGGDPPEPRSFHRMVCIHHSLYVFGGCTAEHGRAADLHRFDLETKTWHKLESSKLRGRGGPTFLSFSGGAKLGVVAGFVGQETADGQMFHLDSGHWDDDLLSSQLAPMRPRSVSVGASFPRLGVSILFGGEVDPSDKGHEGAGAFESDVVVLDHSNALVLACFKPESNVETPWPQPRGWADADSFQNKLFLFGGLAGDDENPKRLDDLWSLELLTTPPL